MFFLEGTNVLPNVCKYPLDPTGINVGNSSLGYEEQNLTDLITFFGRKDK